MARELTGEECETRGLSDAKYAELGVEKANRKEKSLSVVCTYAYSPVPRLRYVCSALLAKKKAVVDDM